MEINEATGEVSITLADRPFRLRATMPRVAAFQAAIGVRGIDGLEAFLLSADPRAVYFGLRCLCSSGNADLVENLLMAPHLGTAIDAVHAALRAGLPEAEKQPVGQAPGNGEAPPAKATRRGRATDRSPSASSTGARKASQKRQSATSSTLSMDGEKPMAADPTTSAATSSKS